MKLLLLIVVILGVVWLARGMRKPKLPPRPQHEAPKPSQEEMVSCTQCGVHLPRSEALPGRGGLFCSEAHRSAYEHQRGS